MARKKKDKEIVDLVEDTKMTVDETIAYINKVMNTGNAHKVNVIRRASESVSPFLVRRPFRIASIDTQIGGGLPAGGISVISGGEGVGKNSLAHAACAAVQHNYGEQSCIAWCWLEIPYDKPHGRINGVVVPESAEELELENLRRGIEGRALLTDEEIEERTRSIGDFLMICEGTTEQRLEAVLDLLEQNICQLIAVDSISAAVPRQRVATPLDQDPQQSAQAILVTEFMRMCWNKYCCSAQAGTNFTSLLITNQMRGNRNRVNMFSPQSTAGGAYALRHGKLLDIQVSRGEEIPPKNTPKIGKKLKWKITKGKAGSHEGPVGELAYYFDDGFDRYSDLFTTACNFEVIVRSGSGIYDFVDENGVVFQERVRGGADGSEIIRSFYEDPELFERVYIETLKKAGVSCLHRA